MEGLVFHFELVHFICGSKLQVNGDKVLSKGGFKILPGSKISWVLS
jgi:hypothetical protein